ncbi:hypothetical protein LCGC14_1534980 [marine sediment metagenome]|uniref:Uncharacterized protein n=1 Tax=marine sediment metagenome TaxID=412755 RepID=A0A0F9IUV7_9ZZZZ
MVEEREIKRVEACGNDLRMVGDEDLLSIVELKLLAAFAEVPLEYLLSLPPTLAAQNINHGLKAREKRSQQ